MTNTNEEWRQVLGFEGLYEVSNMGRVRSMNRTITRSDGQLKKLKEKILKQTTGSHGRLSVSLSKDGKKYYKYPHILVAEAFIGERPEGYHICHIDGDYTNNKLSNIRYDTVSENAIDIYRYGKKSGSGKLSIEQVLEIRTLFKTGKYTKVELGKMFKVTDTAIGRIIKRETFQWLNDDGSITESVTSVS